MSGGNKKDTTKNAAKGAAVSTGATLLPYAAIGVAGLYLYKKYGEDVEDAFSGVTGAAGGISKTINTITETVNNAPQSITETVNNTTKSITETVNNTTKSVSTFIEDNTLNEKERADIEHEAAAFTAGSAPGVKLPKLDKESQKLISKYSDDKKKVSNFRESPYLNFGLGGETSPEKRSMQGLDEDGLKRINKVIKEGKLTQAEQNTNSSGGSSKSSGGSSKNNLKKPKIVKNKSGMTNKEAQEQGLSPAAWRGSGGSSKSSGGSSKSSGGSSKSSGGSSKNNLKKPKIVKNKSGMSNKEAQKHGLSPAAWRGI